MENVIDGMRLFDSSLSLRHLPIARSLALTAMATLLAVADWLPENPYVDPDHVEFVLSIVFGVSAVLLVLRERSTSASIAAWRNRLILLTISIAATLIGAEFVTRFVFRDVTTSSDNGGYFSRRWYRNGQVQVNAFGFREREFDPVKPKGVYRIAIVGDSFTFGNGIRQQDRFSDLLQQQLPSHFEVLNFGQAGANTPEHRLRVQELLQRVNPDFILVQWYVNDVEGDDAHDRPRSSSLMPIRSLHNWLNDTSALYTVANMKWAELQVAFGLTSSYHDYLKRRLGDPNSADSVRDRELLRDMIASSQRAHVPIGIVLFPDAAGALDASYPFQYLHDRVRDVCGERGIPCLDLREAFSRVKDRRSLWANRLDHHPSANANAIAAEKILGTYSGMWAASPAR